MIKDLRTNYTPISDYTMACIADYMDDVIREQVHFDCAPCTNEQFIAEYASRLQGYWEEDFDRFLSEDMNLDLDDIIYTAYCERYKGKVVDSCDIEWFLESREVLRVTNNGRSANNPRMTCYTVMMRSGDFDIYSREEEQ